MTRPICCLMAGLLSLVLMAGWLHAADPAPLKKDPVQSAFALPRGMVLTGEEIRWANQIRAQLEPRLRAALDRVEEATSNEDKLEAVKEVRQVRDEIKMAIGLILQQRAMKAAQAYAKRMQEQAKKAAEARKRAAAQRKKHGGKRKKKRR